jgi:hypothetical protein
MGVIYFRADAHYRALAVSWNPAAGRLLDPTEGFSPEPLNDRGNASWPSLVTSAKEAHLQKRSILVGPPGFLPRAGLAELTGIEPS